jgi:hypothetical protein
VVSGEPESEPQATAANRMAATAATRRGARRDGEIGIEAGIRRQESNYYVLPATRRGRAVCWRVLETTTVATEVKQERSSRRRGLIRDRTPRAVSPRYRAVASRCGLGGAPQGSLRCNYIFDSELGVGRRMTWSLPFENG